MSAKQLSANIGKIGRITFEQSLEIQVTIKDARQVFNRLDYLIVPCYGAGERWINGERVDFSRDNAPEAMP